VTPPDPDFIEQSDTVRWVTAYARHVRTRFNSRAVVSLRRDGEAVRLRQVYAMEGGGLVLVEEDEHEHGEHEHGEHEHGEHEHDAGGDTPFSSYECPRETWVASPEQVVLEACKAADGEWCTGFGYLGRSRTPHVLVPRAKEPPPKRGHDH
jgi:hypothetical protein